MCSASAGGGTGGEPMIGECDNEQAMLQMCQSTRETEALFHLVLSSWGGSYETFSESSEAGDLSSPEVLSKGALEKAQALCSRSEHLWGTSL
jgi:hypothetical protein